MCHRHPLEIAGCMTIILALVGFLVVGRFVPNPAAVVVDRIVTVFALLAVILFGLGHWILRKPPS